jgi:Ser/Thr protein kinase RdoA (MazF antagonist)
MGDVTGSGAGPHLTRASPVLPVRDLRRTLSHYDGLGFTTLAHAGGDGYGFADRDGVGLHFAADAHRPPGVEAGEAYLFTDDADALALEWGRPGVGGITRPVADTPYRLREGSHVDPDGNLIRFGSPVDGPSDATRLRAHLGEVLGSPPTRLTELDLGVFLVEAGGGPDRVARLFPPARTTAAAGEADLLRVLADRGFPAERAAPPEPFSRLGDRGVVLTEFVEPVPRARRRAAIKEAGGLHRLGELLGQLHALPVGPELAGLRGGAWHHLAPGGPGDEIAAAGRLLAAAECLVPDGWGHHYEALAAALSGLDDGDGLPEGLIHPDFVLANVVASPDRGLVVVDWAGAGFGPRIWPLAFLLAAEGAKHLGRVDRVVAGYRAHVDPEPEELERLARMVPARSVVLEVWRFCMGRAGLAEAAARVAEVGVLAEVVAGRARSAFAGPA